MFEVYTLQFPFNLSKLYHVLWNIHVTLKIKSFFFLTVITRSIFLVTPNINVHLLCNIQSVFLIFYNFILLFFSIVPFSLSFYFFEYSKDLYSNNFFSYSENNSISFLLRKSSWRFSHIILLFYNFIVHSIKEKSGFCFVKYYYQRHEVILNIKNYILVEKGKHIFIYNYDIQTV